MRSSIFFIAPFVAAAYAQSSDVNTTVSFQPPSNPYPNTQT